jgi:Protein of unknown function (DUF3224)
MKEIKGKFEIKSTPIEPSSVTKELGLMHMKFDKKFEGPLSGTGVVSMMGIMNKDLGSGGYVALEKVAGELDSKKGTFYMQHSSSMQKGSPTQSISVVPDSGTAELTGIKGEMKIDIIDGQHFYTFNFELLA